MGGEASGVREPLAAVVAPKWLLAGMDPHVLLEVVFELEGLVALLALELPQQGTLIVADHVPLESVDIGEGLVANAAGLKQEEEEVCYYMEIFVIKGKGKALPLSTETPPEQKQPKLTFGQRLLVVSPKNRMLDYTNAQVIKTV